MSVRRVVAGLIVGGSLLFAAPAAQAVETPTLRLTAKTESTISVAWTVSRDAVRYELTLWENAPATLQTTQTSHTFTGLRPNGQYYVYVVAVDRFGRKAYSNQLTVVTNPDRVAPSTPSNVRVTGVTASKISLAWNASTDNAGIAEYQLSINPGNTIWTSPTSVDIVGLPPRTTFAIGVRARDFGWNFSPFSAPVTATTLASTDTTPPTVPTNFRAGNSDGCGEIGLSWTQSTDDQDPQAAIRYQVLVNGAPDPIGFTPIVVARSFTYALVDGANTFALRAVDSAGNASAPTNAVTLDVHLCT
jgi:chitodextrinase